MPLKDKIYYSSIWILLWLINYIWWFISTISFIVEIIIYWSIFFIFYIIYKKIKKDENYLNYKDYLILFIKKISLSFLIIIILLWVFWYYQNIISPAKMPQFTITNWKKVVVFQAMSHIWTQNFYNQIKNEIIKYKKEWYVYFFEWVKPWTKQNSKEFNKAIWIKFDKNLYKNFSKLYWVVNQDNSIFLWLVNNKDYNVDLNIDDIIKLYNKKIKKLNKKEIEKQLPKNIIDINSQIIDTLSKLNPKQLEVIRFFNKAMLNVILKNQIIQDTIMKNFTNKTLFDVILIERNKNIVKNIENSKYKKIFITYWLLHFNWVFNLLKKDDPNWKITKIKYFYPIR